MNFIKKRLFLIVCVMVFLVGVCLMVLSTMVRADNLKELAKIEAEYKNMSSLRSQVVHENVLSKLKKNAEDAQSDAARVAEIAGQSSKRPLLFKEVFPEPKESQTLFYEYFAENYCRAIDGFIQQLNGGDRPSTTEIDRLLQDHRERSGGVSGTGNLGGRYSPSMSDRSSSETLEDKLISGLYVSRAKKVSCYVNPDVFCCYDYWKSHPDGPRDTMLLDSWFTQLAAWIQEDVVLSINQLNRVEVSVLENPVKRLIEVSFGGAEAGTMMTGGATVTSRSSASAGQPSGALSSAGVAGIVNPSRLGLGGFQYDGYGGGNAAARRDANSGSRLPGYVMFQKSVGMGVPGVPGVPGMPMTMTMPGSVGTASGSEGSLTGTMTTPLTDRSSNDLIDVVHFEVAVIIDSTRINDFTNALQDIKYSADDPESSKRNQITILKLQIDPVDMEAEKTLGYRYGVASLSVLRLVCEYVFFKAGYEAYKPDPVKKLLLQETSGDSRTGFGYPGPGFGGGLSPQR